jgi:hypothetical protein
LYLPAGVIGFFRTLRGSAGAENPR